MGEIRKIGNTMVIKAPAYQMYDMWASKLNLFSRISPGIVNSVDVLEGELGEEGCVVLWKFSYEGKEVMSKEKMEVIDKENNLIVFNVTEGVILDFYKSYKWIFQASPNGNWVRWTVEYEKENESVPEPYALLGLAVAIDKDIDAYLDRA